MKSYPFLPITHHAAIETALRQHEVITERMVVGLYQVCCSLLKSEEVKSEGIMTSKLAAPDYTLATATDIKTGIYVQLAQAPGKCDAVFTFGQKYTQEKLANGHPGAVHQFLYW